ncbi:ribulose-phosphate 3-epimerase [Treponema sp.]|uniref:ribulose-phosphate 3-epimerase n=1 Tax=Treponema sp. TaxID=166 RepID=UPI00298E7C1C|nr:ribulose-phosphate 3-epimerase [Treponema sp.]MCR5613598.1 ribulose-phosphate 3-epimerase [Treponema sp.]
MKNYNLAPSLLSADFSNLANALKMIEDRNLNTVHIDVMDGAFVPQISYGQPVVKSLRPLTKLIFDVHLMVEHPERQIQSFAECGSDFITFHYEATDKVLSVVDLIHSYGKKAGISIKPATDPALIEEYLDKVELVLVMTVEPGFGGQKIIPECVEKIRTLVKMRQERNLNFIISVDGGVNENTIQSVIDAGADEIVSGSAFYSGRL